MSYQDFMPFSDKNNIHAFSPARINRPSSFYDFMAEFFATNLDRSAIFTITIGVICVAIAITSFFRNRKRRSLGQAAGIFGRSQLISAVVIASLLFFCAVGYFNPGMVGIMEETFDSGQEDVNTPIGHMSIHGNSDSFFIVSVISMDSSGLGVGQADYYLHAPDGTTSESGRVTDIYGLNRDDPSVNITFNDIDMDGKISANDNFMLKGTGNGGICGSGYTFTIKFNVNDETVMKQATP